MPKDLNDARKSLQKAKESAQARLVALDEERKEIKASIKSLGAALKALEKPSRSRFPNESDRPATFSEQQAAD